MYIHQLSAKRQDRFQSESRAPTGYEWIDFRPKAGGTWGKVIVESIGFCICLGNVIYHFKRRRKAKKDNEL